MAAKDVVLPAQGPAMTSSHHPTTTDGPAQPLSLLLKCIDFIGDTLLITEALPLDAPGPRIVFVNRAFERMTGYAAGEVIGRTPRLLQGPKTDFAESKRIREALDKWQPVRAEFVNYKKNGEEFFVEMDIVPISDERGAWTHWVSIQRDVSSRKRAEAEARALDAQRMESLGSLSSGIAHDFNNIIAAILGNVEIGSLDMQAGQMPHTSMQQIRSAALRARGVVAKILAYARRRPATNAPVQLGSLLLEATDLLRATFPAGVRLDVTYPAQQLWVRGDAGQLFQVLLNLGINAAQSLREAQGQVRFDLEMTTETSAEPSTSPNHSALIRVSDTGSGMDAATRERIFEPYFTTKGIGNGTGLGLSMVWGIVAAHQGSVTVQSNVGLGSCFTLSLPLLPDMDAPSSQVSESSPKGGIGRGEHVLLVDDDEVVVVMLEGMLRRWGFRVTTLRDPLQAIGLVKNSPNDFDAVVTDLNMPRISGLQLAREIRSVAGDLPVILGSGDVDDELIDAASEAGIAAVFPKEFAVERLGELLTSTLSRPVRPETPAIAQGIPTHSRHHMQGFLTNNRDELIERCKAKVAERPSRQATNAQLANGVPLFLDQLIRTLSAEEAGQPEEGLLISGAAGGDTSRLSEIGAAATAHGKQLLELSYTVDQVVHDYGDLCQAITDLAVERDAPFSVESFRTLNRCLDNAIADAVTEFCAQRDAAVAVTHATDENQRLGFLVHELRNRLHPALLAFAALESGNLSIAGSTGTLLKRNLLRLEAMLAQAIEEVRQAANSTPAPQGFSLADFIADAAAIGTLLAKESGCTLSVPKVDPRLMLPGNRELLSAALTNLLQNAFKFTQPHTEVVLDAHRALDRILIEVRDHCGGLRPGVAERLFVPFAQARSDQGGMGLGLSIAVQSIKAEGGLLSVHNVPGVGCIFTMDLPVLSG